MPAAGATRAYFARSMEDLQMSFLKQKLSIPAVKFSVLAIALSVWTLVMLEELYESAAMMKYLLLSILMAAVASI